MLINRKLITLSTIFLLATGCKTLPPMPTQQMQNIPTLEGFENIDFSVTDNKIIVAPGTNVNVPSELQAAFGDKIESLVRDAGSEVVDRTLAGKFADEIKLNESMNENFESYNGPIEAKFVVIPKVTSHSFTSEYTRASSYVNKKGETVRVDPYCSYRGKASGTVEIRQLPSMAKVLSVSLTGSDYSTQDNPSSSRCKEQNMISGAIYSSIDDLLVKGTDHHLTINKYVGSQGVIIGARKVEDKIYYETNLGRMHGAKEGLAVKVYIEIDGELVPVANGEMLNSDNVLMKKSYVKLDSNGTEIKKGMIIKLSGECTDVFCSAGTMLDQVKKTTEKLNL
jgi:hypothetical protein